MNIYVLYHGLCPDGFGSAWSAHIFLGDRSGIEYIPITYGSELPEMENGSYIYMLDFSTDAETLRKLGEKNRVVILDHHKTAKANLAKFPTLPISHTAKDEKYERMPYGVFVRFDMNKSGAMLSWEFFHPSSPIPNLIKYVQDRDLWKFELKGSNEFSSHLKCYDFNFEEWDRINELTDNSFTYKNIEEFIQIGKILLIQDQKNIDMICKQAKVINYNGHKVVTVCATSHWSDVGNDLVKKYPEADYSMSFYYSPKNNLVKISLRCKDGFDVSEVATEFGGGGHPKASGYVLKGSDMADFFNMIDKAD